MTIKLNDIKSAGEPRLAGAMALIREGRAIAISRTTYVRSILEAALKDAAARGDTKLTFCARVDGQVTAEEDEKAVGEIAGELQTAGFAVDDKLVGLPDLLLTIDWG